MALLLAWNFIEKLLQKKLISRVRHPVICVNNHVFCSICIEVWLKNNNQCPACRIPITPENPCKEIIGGTGESDPIFSPTVRKHLRKTRLELLHKEYEDEIESLQKEVEDLRGKNLSLQTQLKSLLDPRTSALSCQNEQTSQSANEAISSGTETQEDWSKKLKAVNDMYEKEMDNVEKLKEANKKLSVENSSLLRENLRLKAEVDSRSPQKFGRFTVAALQSKVEQSEREMNRLKKALERSDKYIEEMECQLLQLKNASEGTQTASAVSERVLSTDAKGAESSEDTCLKTQVEEKKALTTTQSPHSLEQLTSGGTCLSSSSQDGSNGSNTPCAPKKELFPGCQGVLMDENTTNMDACLEEQWNKIEECTPYKGEELYDLPPPCTPFLSLSRLRLNTPDGKENTRKPSTFLRKLKFEEFCDTSDDCSKDSAEHSTSSCNSEKKLNCFATGKSGFWGTCPTNFAENLDFDDSEQNSVTGQTSAKSSDKTSSCLPKRLHTLCFSEMNRTRTSSEASMDAAYLDKISELDSMMSESDNSKSPCYNFKSSDLDNASKSTECSKLLNETEKKLEEMNEEQSMKCPETSELAVDRAAWKSAMFSNLSPSELDMNDHFPSFTGQNVVASDGKPQNCLFQRDFSQSLLFSNSQRLFEEQKFGSCFLKMSSDLHNQLNPPWASSFISERKNKNTSQSTKRKSQSSVSSASPSKTTKN
ncbi:PREDICTED: RING finger protein 219 [Chaetura pelagica]|uniref:RING finger protein 219 n=1 Tax=Chaetura pelagica TaxID=8897 RepID=UPI0005235D92|nr:PREDICTED: RING finger protein 219 [Chaetura pelagica]